VSACRTFSRSYCYVLVAEVMTKVCSTPTQRLSIDSLGSTPSIESCSNMYASPISTITAEDLVFLTDGALSDDAGEWEEDASTCAVCGKVFSALLRRHHCRICGRCVCKACSPSTVLLPGQKKPERSCTPCVLNAQRAPAARRRLAQLSHRLFGLGGVPPPQVEPKDLDQAVVLCETALMHHAEAQAAIRGQVDRAEAEIVLEQQARQELASQVFVARDFIYQMGQKLYAMHGGQVPSFGNIRPPSEMSLEEAMYFCEMALRPLPESPEPRQPREASITRQEEITGAIDSARSQSLPITNCSPSNLLTEGALESCHGQVEIQSHDESQLLLGQVPPLDANISPSSLMSSSSSPTWEENTSKCSICEVRLGKRVFKRRHHCRVCGKCVCSACSPNFVLLGGQKNPQRACTPCVSGAQKVPELNRRVSQLAGRLSALGGCTESRASSDTHTPDDLEHSLSLCESALQSLNSRDSLNSRASSWSAS